MTGGQAPFIFGLGLGAIQKALPGQLSAPQSQQAAGLLPSGAPRVQLMVEKNHEPLFHIVVDFVRFPQDIKGEAACQQSPHKPALWHTCHKAHAGENEHKDQYVAHVAGDNVIQPANQSDVPAKHGDGGKGA